ncbi:DUF6567 family protein [Halalkalibaculum sp. DA3122]|uniref:DUF6567 family protein n=1 Tax=Halalkalibaculum sp. DA3122 TaxID=3373607 RepID=UPI0037549CB6
MKNSSIHLFILILLFTIFQGCTNSGAFIASNQTNVNLEEGNFHIVAANVSGSAESGYILGFSYGYGVLANTIAIARVDGTGMLYSDAIASLWEQYEEEHGSIEGKKLALTNVRYDTDIVNAFIYTKVKVMVRADVVVFE